MENQEPSLQSPPTEEIRLPEPEMKTRDGVFAAIFFALSVIGIDFGLFGGFRLGFAISTLLIGLFVCVYCLGRGGRKFFGLFCAACAMTVGATFGLYEGENVKMTGLCVIVALFALAVIELTGSGANTGDWRIVADGVSQVILTPFIRLGEMISSIARLAGRGKERGRKGGAILLGVLASIPILFIIVPLLMYSDAAFAGFMSQNVFSSVPRIIGSVVLGILLFGYGFSGLYASRGGRFVPAAPKRAHASEKGINPYALGAFLGMISLVYAVYLLSQLGYFFGAFASLLPENFTVAEYARHGFFEMTAICFVNLLLITISLLSVRRSDDREPAGIRWLCFGLSAFSLALTATVCAKLVLYMHRFGLTPNRLYVTLFCVIVGILFVCVTIRLFIRRFPYFRVFIAAAALLMVVSAVADINTQVARYNYNAYQDGRLSSVDVQTIAQCGDAGVPYLVGLMDCKDPKIAREAAVALLSRCRRYGSNDDAEALMGGYDPFGWAWDMPDTDKAIVIRGELVPLDRSDFRAWTLAYSSAQTCIVEGWGKVRQLLAAGK